ncbi:MAG: T9SS type A sorting domain-containing protein [Ignavibacteriae bacterium]|nr:T9SS type A sorting domain-containing protein [Ignavibacteriota bacterium]
MKLRDKHSILCCVIGFVCSTLVLLASDATAGTLSYNKTTLNFGTIVLGNIKRDTLVASNNSTDTIRVTAVTSTNDVFSIATSSALILPGQQASFVVTAAPDSVRPEFGFLLVINTGEHPLDSIRLVIDSTTTSRPPRTLVVSTLTALKNAITAAVPGDSIIVANGVYSGSGTTITRSGTAAFPIVIKAQNRGMAQFAGNFYFNPRSAAYVVIEGFLFTSADVTVIKTESCHHIRITRNTFRLTETSSLKWVLIGGTWNQALPNSHHNRIDHNLFEEKHQHGNYITIDGSPEPTSYASQYDLIDHNHFRNIGPRATNEMESIRIGVSSMSNSSAFTTVEYNLFEDCDGDPEIVSVKTHDNIIRYNTFRRSQGTVCLRQGHRSTVEGNFFFGEGKSGTGGVRIYGDDHTVINNYFEGLTGTTWDAPITLTNGDYDGGTNYSAHWQINRATIAFNSLVNNDRGIEIGFANNGSYNKPPRDVVIANNLVIGSQNELVKIITSPVNMTWSGNIMYPVAPAVLGIAATPSQIKVADPLLHRVDSLWKLSASSPAIDSSVGSYPSVVADIDGQTRDARKDIGADEYSGAAISRRPLTAADVGPNGVDPTPLSAQEPLQTMPSGIELQQNYPNPFNPTTTIEFSVSVGTYSYTSLRVYDMLGREVATLVNEVMQPGTYSVDWNVAGCASGVYLYRLTSGGLAQSRKMLLIR